MICITALQTLDKEKILYYSVIKGDNLIMPFCQNCGAEQAQGSQFCVSCGSSIAGAGGGTNNNAGFDPFSQPPGGAVPVNPGVLGQRSGLLLFSVIFNVMLMPITFFFTFLFLLQGQVEVFFFWLIIDFVTTAPVLFFFIPFVMQPKNRIVFDGQELILHMTRTRQIKISPHNIRSVEGTRINPIIVWFFTGLIGTMIYTKTTGHIIINTNDGQRITMKYIAQFADVQNILQGMRANSPQSEPFSGY